MTRLDLDISNERQKTQLEQTLQMETSREQINDRSPDLFSDADDLDLDTDADNQHSTSNANESITSLKDDDKKHQPKNGLEKSDRSMSKHVQSLLSGILPPPSVTFVQHDIVSLLSMYKRNVVLMDIGINCESDPKSTDSCDRSSVPLMPQVLDNMEWPEIEQINAYGVHYNRTKYTENIEMMYMKLVERNVGQETSTSFTHNQSMSAKKKPARNL